MSRVAVPIASVALAACVQFAWAPSALAGAHDVLIAKYAAENGVPEPLVRRVIRIESRGRARVVHKGNYGLMQIRLGTARSMGYSGDAEGLLDPDTNLTYAVKYLAGAYRAAGCDADRAVSYYKRGYHGVKRHNCGPAGIRVAEAMTDTAKPASAKRTSGVAPSPTIDVIKPRVVQTELISKSNAEALPAPRLAKFEPIRVSAISSAAVRPVPLPSPKPAALMAKPEPASAAPMVAALETDATDIVPLPRVRPEHIPEAQPQHSGPRPEAEPVHRAGHRRSHADKKTEGKKPEVKKAEDDSAVPGAVVSFLKKLTTPDKKSRRQAAEEPLQAQSPSQNF
jgi:hypothetical protein